MQDVDSIVVLTHGIFIHDFLGPSLIAARCSVYHCLYATL